MSSNDDSGNKKDKESIFMPIEEYIDSIRSTTKQLMAPGSASPSSKINPPPGSFPDLWDQDRLMRVKHKNKVHEDVSCIVDGIKLPQQFNLYYALLERYYRDLLSKDNSDNEKNGKKKTS